MLRGTSIALVCCGIPMLGLAACQSSGGIVERLDSRSGLTVVTADQLATLARTEARFSRSARDYLYLGPVETNARGTREYFLWIAVASTIDRDYLADSIDVPQILYLSLDGAPVELELHELNEQIPRAAGSSLYEPVIAPTAVFAARVTQDQIGLIARQGVPSARLGRVGESLVQYYAWGDEFDWSGFLGYASRSDRR